MDFGEGRKNPPRAHLRNDRLDSCGWADATSIAVTQRVERGQGAAVERVRPRAAAWSKGMGQSAAVARCVPLGRRFLDPGGPAGHR